MGKEVLSSGCPRGQGVVSPRSLKGSFLGLIWGRGSKLKRWELNPLFSHQSLNCQQKEKLKHFILDYKRSKKPHLLPLNQIRSNAILLTYKLRRLFPTKSPGLLPFQHRAAPFTHSAGRAKPSPWQSSNLWTSGRVKGWSPQSWLNDLVKDTGESVVIT